MVDGVLGAEEQGTLQPALLAAGEGLREFCYIVEDHGDGELTILVPWAPTAFAGFVKIVDAQLVQKIEAKLGDTSRVLNHLGFGARKLLKPYCSSALRGDLT